MKQRPSTHQRDYHSNLCMSDLHARRMREGRTESRPSDYRGRGPASEADRRRVHLLQDLEDERVMRALDVIA